MRRSVAAMSNKCLLLLLTLAALLAALVATNGKGIAATEFCPAEVDLVSPVGERMGNLALTYVYELRALTARSVSAAIIADTDKGWFTWSVSGVELKPIARVQGDGLDDWSFLPTASSPLGVTFPQAVTLRRAWAFAASTTGDETMGWDKRRTVSCEVSPFESASVTLSTPGPVVTPSPLPSPKAPMAIALADSPPFSIEKCKTPFKQADPTEIIWPNRSRDFPDIGDQQIVWAVVLVALDSNGHLLDSWLLESTGYAPVDLALLRSARRADYSGAISYCRHVPGVQTIILNV